MSDAPVNILVVDDLPAQRVSIEAVLDDLGERIVAVESGVDALRFLLDHDAAVVLLDVNMPGMDGFETAELIRRRERTRHTPIIFVTADMDEIQALRAYSLGAVDYLFAPFSPDVLRAKVKAFVELSKVHERLKREAEQRVALSLAQAARAAAEEESRRLRLLAEASRILMQSLDPGAVIRDLVTHLVPEMADVACVALVHRPFERGRMVWVHADASGCIERQGRPDVGDAEVTAGVERALAGGSGGTLSADDGRTRGIVMPLIARGAPFGAMALAMTGSGRRYAEADMRLIRDIVSRASMAIENSRLYDEIHQQDRQKDEFLAMLGHELRNPLGAITTAAGLLGLIGPSDDRAVRARDVVSRQAAQLTRLVDDLLDVSRVTAGRISLARRPMALRDVVDRVAENLRVAGRLDRHRLDVKGEAVWVDGDRARMEQVVTNLLVNAVKYTEADGRIDVEIGADGDEAVFRVRDTGIGISRDMLPRIFDLFVQGRQGPDRSQGGLGIGLTLVRRLVELHGGRVEATSEGLGRGSVFTVRLPRLPTAELEAVEEAIPKGEEVSLRVLVVEDNADARDMLRAWLELRGHAVHEAVDGVAGLKTALEMRPDVAFIDLGLPRLDGVELASRLRATPETRDLLLVAVTGYGQIADQQRTAQAGFDAHLVKPVDPKRLAEILARPRRFPVEPKEDSTEVERMVAVPPNGRFPARRPSP